MNELLHDVFLVGMDDPQRWVEQVAATVSPGVSCAPPPLEPLAHWRAIYPMARAIGNWRNACDCANDASDAGGIKRLTERLGRAEAGYTWLSGVSRPRADRRNHDD